MATATAAPEALFGRVQELQERLEQVADAATAQLAGELVGALVAMYGTGLERMLERMRASDAGAALATSLAEDPVVATLLLIHDLHPVPLSDRVQQALDSVRPYMESHGGDVELLEIHDGVARIHLRGSCSDCSASSVTLELAVKRALEETAPDLAGLEVEGMAPQMSGLALPMADSPVGAELPVLPAGGGAPPPAWVELESAPDLKAGTLSAVSPRGAELVLANVDGTLLAYRDRCPDCGAPLHDGALSDGALACAGCARAYFLPRAGRSLDADGLQLEPVPLLREDGRVKVALAGAAR